MMFILDKIMLLPLQSVMWVAEAVEKAAIDAQAVTRQEAAQRLQDLYRMWEAGEISDDEFDAAEAFWLGKLEGQEK